CTRSTVASGSGPATGTTATSTDTAPRATPKGRPPDRRRCCAAAPGPIVPTRSRSPSACRGAPAAGRRASGAPTWRPTSAFACAGWWLAEEGCEVPSRTGHLPPAPPVLRHLTRRRLAVRTLPDLAPGLPVNRGAHLAPSGASRPALEPRQHEQ